MTQTKPHMLVGKINPYGEARIDLECPYEFGEPNRPCNLGTINPESEACRWYRFAVAEDHHETCPASKGDDATCDWDKPGGEHCWPEEPEQCNGFEYDGEHMHPVPGCYAQQMVNEVGWQEAIRFGMDERAKGRTWTEMRAMALDERTLELPMPVAVFPDEDGVDVAPWSEWKKDQQ